MITAGAMHAEVAKALTREMVFNQQGSFVTQKIVTLSTHAELVALARTIIPLGSDLMTDKAGPHLLMKVVDILVSACCRLPLPAWDACHT